jgi:hypothetical protein
LPNENSSSLISINVDNNVLTGTIPESLLYYCRKLLYFEIYNNGLYGHIPSSFSLLNHSLIGFISSNNFLYGNNTYYIFTDEADNSHDNEGYHKNNLLGFLDLAENSLVVFFLLEIGLFFLFLFMLRQVIIIKEIFIIFFIIPILENFIIWTFLVTHSMERFFVLSLHCLAF